MYIKGNDREAYFGESEGMSRIFWMPSNCTTVVPFKTIEDAKESINRNMNDLKFLMGEIVSIQYIKLEIIE